MFSKFTRSLFLALTILASLAIGLVANSTTLTASPGVETMRGLRYADVIYVHVWWWRDKEVGYNDLKIESLPDSLVSAKTSYPTYTRKRDWVLASSWITSERNLWSGEDLSRWVYNDAQERKLELTNAIDLYQTGEEPWLRSSINREICHLDNDLHFLLVKNPGNALEISMKYTGDNPLFASLDNGNFWKIGEGVGWVDTLAHKGRWVVQTQPDMDPAHQCATFEWDLHLPN
jgi:hypothetical protein